MCVCVCVCVCVLFKALIFSLFLTIQMSCKGISCLKTDLKHLALAN